MTTLTITIPDEVAARLADLAKETGRTVEDLAGEYLAGNLAEIEEDAADLAAARAAEAEGGEPIPLEEVKRRLGME